jgi:hypothetical protein
MPNQRLDVEGLQLHLGEAEGDRRAFVSCDPLIGQLLEEWHVAVAIDGVDDRRIAAGAEALTSYLRWFDSLGDGTAYTPPGYPLPSLPWPW